MIALLQKIIRFDTIAVVGVITLGEKTTYYVLSAKRKGSAVIVTGTRIFSDIDALKSAINLPVILLLDGKGILNRKVNLEDQADRDWQKNIDYSTTYDTSYIDGINRFISLGRKAPIDEQISEFISKGLTVFDFYIGPLPAVLLKPALSSPEIVSNGSGLVFIGEKLESILRNPGHDANYKIGDTDISGYHLPLYGLAVNHFLKDKLIVKTEAALLNAEEAIYKKAFEVFGMAMLGTFFALLLVSYFSTGYFSDRYAELSQKNVFAKESEERIVKMKAERDEKLQVLHETGLLSDKFISYYPYEISRMVSESLKLTRLDVFPVGKEFKDEKKVILDAGHIIVSGSTAQEQAFSQFIDRVKKMDWIRKLEILSLKKDKKGISQFELKITVR